MPRCIDDILLFRTDISPFLVHLTKQIPNDPAQLTPKNRLEMILDQSILKPKSLVSDLQFAGDYRGFGSAQRMDVFSAVCFTETPLPSIHCLIDIDDRQIDLSKYGIVFLKKKCKEKGVGPAIYINNIDGSKQQMFEAIFDTINNPEYSVIAEEIGPFLAVFGKFITSPIPTRSGFKDFIWEREWRYPARMGTFQFDLTSDVFVGLCEDNEIPYFESKYDIPFIDPTKPCSWYAKKLVARRKALGLDFSVV